MPLLPAHVAPAPETLSFEGAPETAPPAEPVAPAFEPSFEMLAVADDLMLLAPPVETPAVEIVLPEPVQAVAVESVASVTVEAPATPEPVPAEAPVVERASVTVPVTAPAPLVEEGTLPWDLAAPLPPEAPVAVQVSAAELAALPWHAHAPIEEHVEIMAGNPRSRRHVDRPTMAPSFDASAWGLPWPRPVPAADALSIADPRIWSARERVHAVREDLDARVGAASFGAVKPEGSAWLRRVQDGPR